MPNKFSGFACALLVAAMALSSPASADDPRDRTMASAAARTRDQAITTRMNRDQLDYVRQREDGNLQDYRNAQSASEQAYADARAEYARKLSAWRRAVAACNAGQWEYCGD